MMNKILFRTGILQIFFVFTLVLCIAISINFYYRTSIIVENLAKKISERSAERVITQTHEFLSQPANYGKIIAQILAASDERMNIIANQQRIWRMLWQPLINKDYIQSLFVADNRGNYVQVRRDAEYAKRYIDRSNPQEKTLDYKYFIGSDGKLISETAQTTTFDPRLRPWFIDAERERKTIWSDIFMSTSAQAAMISIGQSIVDETQTFRGVVSVNIPLYHFSNFIDSLAMGGGTLIFIANSQGQLLGHSSHKALTAKDQGDEQEQKNRLAILTEINGLNMKGLMQTLEKNHSTQLNYQGNEYHVREHAIPNTYLAGKGWKVLLFSPLKHTIVAADIKVWLSHLKRFLDTPEQIVQQIIAEHHAAQSLHDIITIRDALWKAMWPELINHVALQSILFADERGNYVQVRREPYLATRIIDRDNNELAQDERFYRLPNFDLVALKIKPSNFDPRERPWYQGTTAERDIQWSDIFVSTSAKTPVISATYPIMPRFATKYDALVGVNLPLYQLSDFFAENDVSKNGYSFMLDGAGQLIAHADKSQILIKENDALRMRLATESDDPLVKLAFAELFTKEGRLRDFFSIQHVGQNYLVVAKEFPAKYGFNGWKVLSIIPEKDLLSDLDNMLLMGALIALAILLVSMIIVYFIANRISRPLHKLADSMGQLTNFKLDKIEGVQSRFIEVDEMSNAILRARDGLRSFQKYVPADLVRQLIKTNQAVTLGGHDQQLTMMFTDIEGFTSISEKLPAQDLMLHLSDYLDALTTLIMEENGTIDKYIGDAIMAFWGAPTPLDNPVFQACRAALRCQDCLAELNKGWQEKRLPQMKTRIGLATGGVVVGNLGSNERMNYTVIGDSVNLASRLEGLNKFYGTAIIVCESTQREVQGQFYFRLLDKVAVKGQSNGICIYELLAERQEGLDDAKNSLKQSYEAALSVYMQQNFEEAKLAFSECLQQFPEDLASKEMLKRCELFVTTPPDTGGVWNGVYSWQVKG